MFEFVAEYDNIKLSVGDKKLNNIMNITEQTNF
jgi:hypothetical protein